MFSHITSCHPPPPRHSKIYQDHLRLREPMKVFQKSRGAPEIKSVSNISMGQNAFAGLALRQPGAIVPSLETSHCYLRFFVHLLTYVGDAGIAAAHPEQHGISMAEWVRLACFSCWLPSHVRRTCPNFWRALPEALLTDTFRGSPLSMATGEDQGIKITNLVEARRKRTIKQIREAGRQCCLVLQAGQSSMRDLGYSHEEHVVYSHGDHIPLHVRNASVVAFWLPDVLGIAFEAISPEQARRFFPKGFCFPYCGGVCGKAPTSISLACRC